MWLRKITAEGFRAFSEASWEFPTTGLTFVAGANNAGKSSLLATLDAVAGRDEGSTDTRTHASSVVPASVTAQFLLSDIERINFLPGRSDGKDIVKHNHFKHVELYFEQKTDSQLRLTEIRVESTPLRQFQRLAFFTYSSNQNLYTLQVATLPQGAPLTANFETFARLTVSNPDDLTQYSQVPEISVIINALKRWRTNYFHFRALRPGSQRSTTLNSEVALNPTGDNLPAVLLGLTTNRPKLMQQLRDLISTIVPDVGVLETPTAGNRLEVAFSDPFNQGFRHNLKELGTGVEQLLMTIVVGLTQEVPCTLVIEEPETNLHPAAQRAVLGLLREWAADRLIVIATHSPVMLDRSGGQEGLWHVVRENGKSSVSAADSEPADLFRSLGVRLSDVLSADRILVVEGPSDEEVLAAWFPEYMRDPRLAVVQGGGGDNARHAEMLSRWLAGADRIGPRKVIFMRDRDELSPELLERLDASPTVHVLGRRELENYMLEPEAIRTVLANLAPDDQNGPSTADVRSSIYEAANSLRQAVVINRVARRLQPVRLMDNRLRQSLVKENASSELVKSSVFNLLPTTESIGNNIDSWWDEAEQYIKNLNEDTLLQVAPGADILDAVFMKFARMHFNKRSHAVAVAKEMHQPPNDLRSLLDNFMA